MSTTDVSDGEAAKNSSKLTKVVERLKDASREPSPEPLSPASSLKDGSKGGGSSRRKPKVTHKVVDTDDDGGPSGDEGSSRRKPKVTHKVVDTDDDGGSNADEKDGRETPFETYKDTNGVNDPNNESKGKEEAEKKDDDIIDVDEDGNPILPEGTVMVEPQAVEEKRLRFQGPEFGSRKRHKSNEMDVIRCTACNKQININFSGSAFQHPVLKVLVCKKCYTWYVSDIITKDSDGDDEQCTWCGDGGNLFICDCQHGICKPCVQRNMGRAELGRIEEDDNWKCYICNPSPLERLRKDCDRVLETVEEAARKKQELKDQKEQSKKERMQKKEEKAKAKSTTTGKGSSPKKTPPQSLSQEIMQQLLSRNKNQLQNLTAENIRNINAFLAHTTRRSNKPILPNPLITNPRNMSSKPLPTNIFCQTSVNAGSNRPIGPIIVNQFTTSGPPPNWKSQTQTMQQFDGKVKSHNVGDQVLMHARGNPGNLVLVPRGTKPGTVIQTAQGKIVLDMHTSSPSTTTTGLAKLEYLVTTENVEQTLDKALASTESMAMLLRTLKADLRESKQSGIDDVKAKAIKSDVAKKVRRALDAQVRTLDELHRFTKKTAAPKVVQRPMQPAQMQNRSPCKVSLLKASAQPTPPRVQDVPELAGMNIGQVVTPSGLNSAVGKNVIISKETLSSNIQLVTLSDGRVLAVQTVPGGVKKTGPSGPKGAAANSTDIIELDSSDDDSPKKDSPPAKKYKPGPKCSKINRPGPKCSKINLDTEKISDSNAKKEKFKMRISLGARSFPGATGSKKDEKSDSEASDSSDDKPLKPRTDKESKTSDKENENEDNEDEKCTDDMKDDKNFKKDKDGDDDSKDNSKGSSNNKDSSQEDRNADNKEKDGNTDNGDTNKDRSDGNTEGELMEVDDECFVLKSQLDGADTAEEMELLNSESTRHRKDKGRDALLADTSSNDEASGNEITSPSKEKNTITAREQLLADDSDKERADIPDRDKKGRRELLADDSSDNEEVEKISKVGESNDKESLLGENTSAEGVKNNSRTPKKKLSQRGRQELLADKSSDDEVSERLEGSSRTKNNKNRPGKSCAKGREALLADNSSSEEEEKTTDAKLETSQCKDNKGRDALLADDSESKSPPKLSKEKKTRNRNRGKDLFANGSSDDDKENFKADKQPNGYTKDSLKESDKVPIDDIVGGKYKKGKVEESDNSDVNEEEGGMGFVILGEYNASTNEINKLDDDILVQLDGAGKGLTVINENGKQQSDDEATAESMEESSEDEEQVKNKGKGKSSTRFPSKKGKKEGACNDVESSDNEGAKSGGSKKKITKKVKKASDEESDDDPLESSESEGGSDSLRGSDEEFMISESSLDRTKKKHSKNDDRQKVKESSRKKQQKAKKASYSTDESDSEAEEKKSRKSSEETRSKEHRNPRSSKPEKNSSEFNIDSRKRKLKPKESSRRKSRKVFDSDDSDVPISDGDEELCAKRNSSKHKRPPKSKTSSQDLHKKRKDEESDSLSSDVEEELSALEKISKHGKDVRKNVVVVNPVEVSDLDPSVVEKSVSGTVNKPKKTDRKKKEELWDFSDDSESGHTNESSDHDDDFKAIEKVTDDKAEYHPKKNARKESDKINDSESTKNKINVEDNIVNEISSSEDAGEDENDEENEDDEHQDIDLEKKKEIEEKRKKAKEIEEKLGKEEKDRKALLDSDSDGSDSPTDLDDSDEEVKVKKSKKSVKKTTPLITKELVIELSDCEKDSHKKKKKQKTRKTRVVIDLDSLSDSSLDGKKKNKRKGKDSDPDIVISDDSDFETTPKKKRRKRKRDTSDSESETSSEEVGRRKKGKGKKKRRRRIKKMSSSEAESDDEDAGSGDDLTSPNGKKRKKIRKVLKDKKLKEETKSAAKAEEERRKRISERQKLYNEVVEVDEETKQQITTKCVLETTDDDEKLPLVEVNERLIRKLKPHQVEAVKFLWDSCCESVKRMKKEPGAGCILAHCMGLGKTLSLITFVHTLMRNGDDTDVHTALVICPLNTVLNWQREWVMWSEELPDDEVYDVYEMASAKTSIARTDVLGRWRLNGGLLIIGYEMYRNLTQHKFIKSKKQKEMIDKALVEPGPDVVICDEGHILKNSDTAVSKAVSKVRTRRRIVLTGTPLQNNLIEYHCMVDFVKPNLLGTLKEFRNRFANPITNGQCADSTPFDVKLMKRRAHILHETLDGCVQRRDYSALAKFLPPKQEYVISIRLSKVQIELYRNYLEKSGQGLYGGDVIGKGARLFSDYQNLMKIWTHPWVLRLAEIRDENKKAYDEDSMDSFIDDDDEDSDMSFNSSNDEVGTGNAGSSGTKTRATRSTRNSARRLAPSASDSDDSDSDSSARKKLCKEMRNSDSENEVMKKWKTRSRGGDESGTHGRDRSDIPPEEEPDTNTKISDQWWANYVSEEDQYKVELGGKILLLSEILKMCESIGDKVLIFSQSLLSLDLIEDFLSYWHEAICRKAAEANNGEVPIGINGWLKDYDYFRMDGSTSAKNRKRWSEVFNEEDNHRARLFLISTKAGSLGTNMVGANRVIIFDASWNPSHDIQSIFRVYRFGQTKPCYIYRFLAQGTMEEKIYGRQVSKQSLSARVVDEHQIDRHFTFADLKELYNFQPAESETDEVPALPKDRLLAELLQTKKGIIYKFHEHDSLLENKVEEVLTEEERKAAWEEYENEKKGIINTAAARFGGNMMNAGQPGFSNMVMQMRQQAMMQPMGGLPTATAPIMPMSGISGMTMAGGPISNSIENVCRSIMASNPGITHEELQRRIESYLTIQYSGNELVALAQQQQQLQQRQALEQHRLRMMQQRDQELRQRLMATANSGGASASQLLQSGGPVPTGLVQNSSSGSTSSDSQSNASSITTLQNLLNK